jgi:hypothetical protein
VAGYSGGKLRFLLSAALAPMIATIAFSGREDRGDVVRQITARLAKALDPGFSGQHRESANCAYPFSGKRVHMVRNTAVARFSFGCVLTLPASVLAQCCGDCAAAISTDREDCTQTARQHGNSRKDRVRKDALF